ncbi:ExbD/TolR family protein [Alkalisalibacterium limincola]|uniref:Biopolymer transporter ExbD n=1 Tax=Alkalisalibacterium limincola TaxID=2699169 RepID=A0A5C8KV80_9GAMM|nr:biopolymer transporter ExbD [Alkalisalibacterium limincola]TXK65619.1 biopolymer transporter ExbD [Alkalisalibacterium limincola]
MRLDTGRLRDEPEISLTSLIDVVFTLIIFFVITTTFDERAAIELNLPESSAATALEPDETLVVAVDGEGRFFVGDQEVLRRDVESLRAAIARVAGEDRTRPVTLRADARAQHQSVVTAMDALGQLGFTRISIATQAGEAP